MGELEQWMQCFESATQAFTSKVLLPRLPFGTLEYLRGWLRPAPQILCKSSWFCGGPEPFFPETSGYLIAGRN